ncbi:ABC transporter substrate-binding protein [Oceanobacillus arenosus]|uniref:ABC transporter substrate-binding protein n=1 Tax=Oceanobacillus arenosus TaxID=1229153 RepID=A0A3D8PIU1_9BACI|nr:extracellular solute-binding protein [Oceanobacillus arenosus]RDW16013.1 ABC transporter substrate-binding protein [Oceanobacillus arenosus]
MNLKKYKNKLIMFAFILISVMLLAACDDKTSESRSTDTGTDSDEKYPFSISLRTLGLPYVENHSDINEDEYVKQLEEYTNTDLDIRLMPHDDFQVKLDLMFASGDIPDVVSSQGSFKSTSSNGQSLKQAVEAEVFLPLDDLIDEYGPNLKESIPAEVWDDVRGEDGKIYAIPQILSNPARRATVIRKDLLDQTGLDVPTTVEETLDVLRAFKELGVPQPYVARSNFSYSDTFFAAYDVQPMWELDESGNPVPKFYDTENMEKAIQTYRTMYEEGLIHPEFLTQDVNKYKNLIESGDVGMWAMNANALVGWDKNLKQNVPDAETLVIPSPIGPDGKGGYQLYSPVQRSYLINQETESPEKIIQFFDWMVSEEAETFFTYGVEGEDYTIENGEINYIQPESTDEVNREVFRATFLWLIADAVYTEGLLEMTPEGQDLINVFDEILSKEGRSGIEYNPPLDTFATFPALQFKPDSYPTILLEHIAKMVTGAEPVENWEGMLEEWESQGGNKILEEAKERYDSGTFDEPITPPGL